MNKVETKVVAGALGAGGGSVTAQFTDYLLSITVYHHGSVPTVVQDFVLFAVTGVFAFVAAFAAPHTAQPVQAEPAPNEPVAGV